ncbi:MAG: hypothetical protein HKO57_14430, partial [Akkermansiaceae bacterium]|nr:hypothetical protein [Akkermansiaceae bacterium]
VVHNRALVTAPWKQFRTLGNSLFKWRLVFGIIVVTAVLLIVGGTAFAALAVRHEPGAIVAPLVIGAIVLVVALVPVGYISVLLEHFVVPVMYRDSILVNDAWRRFLALHGTALGTFVLFFLWNMLLNLASGLIIILLGIGTCCIGFIILAIPYLGAVLLLPITTFFRFLGPEFLRQFGPEWDVLAPREATS